MKLPPKDMDGPVFLVVYFAVAFVGTSIYELFAGSGWMSLLAILMAAWCSASAYYWRDKLRQEIGHIKDVWNKIYH